jgi:hypothetical protein
MGGLGNQLFQYALGRHLAMANAAELILDASGYERPDVRKAGPGLRKCELGHFRIAGKLVDGTYRKNDGASARRRRAEKLLRLLRRLGDIRKPYHQRHEIVEPSSLHFHFDPRLLHRKFRGSISVRGFWQCEKYFVDIQDVLRQELTWRDSMAPELDRLADRIRACTAIAVHVRHGDNASSGGRSMGVLPRAYYEATMRALESEVSERAFFVFSDDGAWAKQLLGSRPDLTYVAYDQPGEAHRELQLMSLCRHHILANSTLSWWGAWLGKKEGQIVFAPRRYHQGIDRPNPDLYPAEWRLI